MSADDGNSDDAAAVADPRSIPVAEIDFSVRTTNVLKNANIVYLGDLISWTESGLLSLQNCGRKSVREILSQT